MRKYYLGYSEYCELINGLSDKFGTPFECWDCREGSLQDYSIGSFYREGCHPFTIMAKEHYLNPWNSDLEITIARTERDNKIIERRWYEFTDAYDAEYPEESEE